MQRVAMLSVHTSPLAQPGSGDGGGMNVYVHALASALARRASRSTCCTRAEHAEQPPVRRGRARLPRAARDRGPARARCRCTSFPTSSAPFTDAARATCSTAAATVRRAPRELLGVGRGRPPAQARARPPARHHVPHARAREGRGRARRRDPARARASRPRSCAAPTSSSRRRDEEHDQLVRHYGADPERIEIIPPGVDHTVFSPGDRGAGASRARPRRWTGAAVRRAHPAAQGRRPRGRARSPSCTTGPRELVVVGGPSGPDGEAELAARSTRSSTSSGSSTGCASSPPQPHDAARRLLPRRRRVRGARRAPSRSASSRSRPPRAARPWSPPTSAVCGSLVDDGAHRLSSSTTAIPRDYADADRPRAAGRRARRAGRAARTRGRMRYRWSIAAARLRRHYDDLTARAPRCKCS